MTSNICFFDIYFVISHFKRYFEKNLYVQFLSKDVLKFLDGEVNVEQPMEDIGLIQTGTILESSKNTSLRMR